MLHVSYIDPFRAFGRIRIGPGRSSGSVSGGNGEPVGRGVPPDRSPALGGTLGAYGREGRP